MAEEKLVKFLCVQVKPGETQEKLKAKVLKTISNSEKKATPTSASHPLQAWTEEAHCITELCARDVVKVASNSSHISFLLSNGHACRLPMSTREESSSVRTFSSLDALRISGLAARPGERGRFQVIGDEEYAQQLQSELNADMGTPDWSRNRNISPPSISISNDVVGALEDHIMDPDQPFQPFIVESPVFGSDEYLSSDPLQRWSFPQLGTGAAVEARPSLSSILNQHPSTERKGGAKVERKKAKAWPEIGALEWAVVKQNPDSYMGKVCFIAMASLHSEVLLVSAKDRALYSWSCASRASPRPHPLAKELGLEGERVALVESSDIRATVVTESGKVATFYDELLRVNKDSCDCGPPSLVHSLTHRATVFPELERDEVSSLSVSSFLTSAITKSGKLLWWGLCPPTKTNNSDHTHSSSNRSSSTSRGVITDGILVRLRNGPPCGPNSIVFNESGLQPRVGKTMNIIEHSGLDPKTSILVKVYRDARGAASKMEAGHSGGSKMASLGLPRVDVESQFEGLEVWSLSDVVFLDDSPAVLGRVVTVDQLQAIVDISHSSSESGTMSSTSSAQSTLKVFKLSEIETCMDSRLSTSPRKDKNGSLLQQQRKTVGGNDMDTSTSKGDVEGREVVTQHIAGLVQHVPVCVICPCCKAQHTSATLPEQDCNHTHSSCIHGYHPLAMRMTDNGPMVLVERLSDGKAFLTCSGHSGFPSFLSSSFVSLNSRDSKLGRCTIEEESVSALDGGYEKRHHPNSAAMKDGTKDGTKVDSGWLSILKLHKSQAMMLIDVSGHICSLSEGLRLTPTPLSATYHGQDSSQKSQPVQSYKFVVTQTHTVKKDTNMLVIVAVPQEQVLMPTVLSGDVAKLDAIINQFEGVHPPCGGDSSMPMDSPHPLYYSNGFSTTAADGNDADHSDHDGVEDLEGGVGGVAVAKSAAVSRVRLAGNNEDESLPPLKKLKTSGFNADLNCGGLPTSVSTTEPPSMISEPMEAGPLAPLSSAEVASKVDFDAELPVVGVKCGSINGCADDSSASVNGVSYGPDIFYELSVQNSNILHVCGQLKDTSEDKTKRDLLKPTLPGTLLATPLSSKSFEELRLEHMTKYKGSSSLWKMEGCGLLSRRLWILDQLLKCKAIEEIILDLLCQHNREGHTPFLSAVQHKNYAAALKMLSFVEQHHLSRPSLLDQALPSSTSTGMSPVHLVLASLSPHFDTQSMVLHVSNFQLTTAQQLLKLFQVRYPSAYKAEVVKKGVDVSDRSSASSEGSGTEDGHGEESLENRRSLGQTRRQYRSLTNRRLRRNRDNLLPSSSQSGRVYFSDVSELRAAAREMQGFRIASNVFRNTGFGTTQTISHLSVGLEPANLEPGDERDDLPYVMESDRLQGNFFNHLRDSLAAFNKRKLGGASLSTKGSDRCSESSPELAYELLLSLLAHPSLITALDQAGETPLAAAIHNPRCIDRLAQLCTNAPLTKGRRDQGHSPLGEVKDGVPLLITSVPNTAVTSTVSASSSGLLDPISSSAMSYGTAASNASLYRTTAESSDVVSQISSGGFRTRFDIPSLSGSDSSLAPVRIKPYVPYVDFVDQTSLDLPRPLKPSLSPTPSRDSSATPSNPSYSYQDSINAVTESADMDTIPSPTTSQSDNPLDIISKTLDEILPGGEREAGGGQGPLATKLEGAPEEVAETIGDNVYTALESAFKDLAHRVQQKVQQKVHEVVSSRRSVSSPTKQESAGAASDGVKNVQQKVNEVMSYRLNMSSTGKQEATGRGVDGVTMATAASSEEKHGKSVKFQTLPTSVDGEPLGFGMMKSITKPLLFPTDVCGSLEVNSSRQESKSPNTVKLLFSDWSSIAMIVLGFDPNTVPTFSSSSSSSSSSSLPSSSPAPSFSFCSVHLLDNFTTDLVLNCSRPMIAYFVDTVIDRLNSALRSCPDVSLVTKELDYTDPEVVSQYLALGDVGVALLVGRRFLGSMVRVLALEHSRIKNRFLEMQQARQAASAQADEQDIHDLLGSGPSASIQSRSQGASGSAASHAPRNTSIVTTVISIISRFSWLAIHALAQAAEGCSYPLRLGVSKPLGASSVVPDYQTNSRIYHGNHYSYVMAPSSQLAARQGQSLVRQLHVRAAKATSSSAPKPSMSLPVEGLLLRPQQGEGESSQSGSTRSDVGVLNTSNQEDSSDEELVGGEDHAAADADTSLSSGVLLHVDPPSYSATLHNEVFLDLDSESSSDDDIYRQQEQDYLEVVGRESGAGPEEDNLDTVYPFAWALDGRRIGENGVAGAGRAESPNSISAMSMFNASQDPPVPLCNIPSIRFGAGFLARTYARLVKDLVDISCDIITDKVTQPSLDLADSLQSDLLRTSVCTLERTWSWAACALDMAETQLVQGQHFNVQRHVVALRGGSGLPAATSGRSSHMKASRSFVGSTPGEYVMSLLRSTHHEDRDCLPVIDLYGYEHVVYVLDGLLYSLKHWPKVLVDKVTSTLEEEMDATPTSASNHNGPVFGPAQSEDDDVKSARVGVKRSKLDPKLLVPTSRFFKRTESVTVGEAKDSSTEISNIQFFGVEGGTSLALQNPEMVGPPNTWEKLSTSFSRPLNEDYPLANQPHLLKPFAKKELLFRGGPMEGAGPEKGLDAGTSKDGQGKGKRGKKRKLQQNDEQKSSSSCTMAWSPEYAHQRWHSAISVFAHIFLAEGPGNERANFLNARAGFASRMARFRHQVSQLYNASQMSRDWAGTVSSTLSIRVKRERLLQDSLTLFKQVSHFHYSNVRVKFDGEDGSGPGVNRGFFASFSYELKSGDMSKSPLSRLGLLFHEPGKQPEQSSLFAPHPFMPHLASSPSRSNVVKSQRREAFVAIGRFLGFCLWFHYTVPFMVCRHVAKVFLGRPLAWHDLAFYNADLYEGLRQMMLDAELGKKDETEFAATYCSYFEAPLPGKFLEPVLVELIPGGSKIPVTANRVHEYVRLYSMFMMVGCVQEELNALKQGLNDVIPNDLLSGLTAEDFQLLLSGGSAEITLSRLKSIITFNHTHKGSRSICDRFEKMFWRVVSHMNNIQRQQLLYFATGSAALPATIDTTTRGPNESLTQNLGITLDVITVRNVHSLPVASTCSQRMCVPLYPSYHILKKKLLQAIQCQAYGLG